MYNNKKNKIKIKVKKKKFEIVLRKKKHVSKETSNPYHR